MIRDRIEREVVAVATRCRTLWLLGALAVAFSGVALLGVAALAARSLTGWSSPWTAPGLAAASAAAALACGLLARRVARDPGRIARRIEARVPELDSALVAALEQEPALPDGRYGFLQESLFRDVAALSRGGAWREAVPASRLRLAGVASAASFAAVVTATAMLLALEPRGAPGAAGSAPGSGPTVAVDPGDAEVERGSSVVVLARFGGTVPDSATLRIADASGEARIVPMARSLDDPVYGARIAEVAADLSYRVEYPGGSSPDYRIAVYELPDVARVDARMVYPAHARLEPATVLDTRRVTAVEGTELTWIVCLNKPVERAWLAAEDGAELELSPSDDPRVRTASLSLTASIAHRVRLLDDRGRENRDPPSLHARVLPNRASQLTLKTPRGDTRVSPIEELAIEARAQDDFGLLRWGVGWGLGGAAPVEVSLGEDAPGADPRELAQVIELEALGARPAQVLTFWVWAEDHGRDGRPRRSWSDMYFAEVRPFEEIFRQGQDEPAGAEAEEGSERPEDEESQGGEEEGMGQQAERLAELQKQILTGTWKLVRAASDLADLGGDWLKDAGLLVESQERALEQASALGEGAEDPERAGRMAAVTESMQSALKELERAVEDESADPLRLAVPPEQAAYEGLLELRDRETLVARSQRPSSRSRSSRASSRMQRQLDQLQLSGSANRYETQRAAKRDPEQSRERAQQNEVLDRLRDLSRRQADANREMRDLQSALSEARTREEQEEAVRRLQRLRDAQERILRDTDEVAQRTERPEAQEGLRQTGERLRDTREDVRRASEELREGRVANAAAAGARAEEELREIGDELRQRTGGELAEEMRRLRSDAESLERTQEDLGNRLAGLDRARGSSLRGTDERQRIQEELQGQERGLDDVLERMQETVEEAEKPEPLVSERLYDTLRQTRQSRTDEALELTRNLLDRGFVEDAGRVEEQAREGIRRLSEGVAEAAEGLLGDDAEALRRARGEVERLSEDVERELARAEGGGRRPGQEGEERPGAEGEGEARQGKPRPGGGTEGEPGERPAGEATRGGGAPETAAGEGDGERPGQEGERPEGEPGGVRLRPGERGGEPREGDAPEVAREGSGGRDREGRGTGEGGEPAAAPSPQDGARPGDRPRETPGGPRTLRPGLGDPTGPGGSGPLLGTDEPGAERRAPFSGEDFRDWSDRLRDVGEMLDDSELRDEAGRILDRARAIRSEAKRHSKEPAWDLVRLSVLEPMKELGRRIGEELLRRESQDARVPIDTDPVPPEYAERVREYYERLGGGK